MWSRRSFTEESSEGWVGFQSNLGLYGKSVVALWIGKRAGKEEIWGLQERLRGKNGSAWVMRRTNGLEMLARPAADGGGEGRPYVKIHLISSCISHKVRVFWGFGNSRACLSSQSDKTLILGSRLLEINETYKTDTASDRHRIG